MNFPNEIIGTKEMFEPVVIFKTKVLITSPFKYKYNNFLSKSKQKPKISP